MDQDLYRIILALVLSGLILFAWQYYRESLSGKPADPVKVSEQVEKTEIQQTNTRKDLSDYKNCGRLRIVVYPVYKLLEFFNAKTGNLGIALILLTLAVRTLLAPLMLKQVKSSKKMQELQGDIQKIKESYSESPLEMQKAMGKLFKDKGVYPLGNMGLLIIQIPLFFALYKIVREAQIFSEAPLGLWIQDLGAADPFYILPLIAGVMMFLGVRFPGATGSQMHKGFIYIYPVFFAGFLLHQPAGLALYFLVGSVVQLGINFAAYKFS